MYVACTYRLSFSIRKSVLDKRERKQLSEWSCWSWLGRAETIGEGLLPTQGWHCSAILAMAALLSAQPRCGGHSKGFPKHHQHPREKPLEQKPRAYPRWSKLPPKQGMSICSQSSSCFAPAPLTLLSPYQYVLCPHQYLHRSHNSVSPFYVQSPGAERDAETPPPTQSLPSTLGQRIWEMLGQPEPHCQSSPNPPRQGNTQPGS